MTTADDNTGSASESAKQQAAELLGGDIREGYAEIGDQRLHYVEAGDGPLIVLLHGFPEFWYGLAAADQTARRSGIPRGRA
jgi:hypothetical protein